MRYFSKKHSHKTGAMDLGALLSVGFFFLVASLAVVYFLAFSIPPIDTKVTAEKAFLSTSRITSYTTELSIAPTLKTLPLPAFDGASEVNVADSLYSGVFKIPSSPGASALEIKTSGRENVFYAKFSSTGTASPLSPLYPAEWVRLAGSEIPEEYLPIYNSLVFGDILSLVREGKGRLSPVAEGTRETIDGKKDIHLIFRLNPPSPGEVPDSRYLSEVSSSEGIHLWVDASSFEPHQIRYTAGGFSVLAKIFKINSSTVVETPATNLSYSDWKGKISLGLAKANLRISEIAIGSYGNIKPAYLEGMRQAVEKSTGIKTTVLSPAPALEKNDSVYDKEGAVWNSRIVYNGVKGACEKCTKEEFILYVVDEKLHDPLTNAGTMERAIGEVGANAGIVSLFGLSNKDDYSTSTAAEPVIIARAQKLALRAIGETVGFQYLPSFYDPKCPMFPAKSLKEIDTQSAVYCKAEAPLIPGIFKK